MREQKKKRAGKDQGPFVRTPKQDLDVVDVVKETQPFACTCTVRPIVVSLYMYACFMCVCLCACVCIYNVNVLYLYLLLGLRITCPNRSQGKTFIWRTFAEMI